jgi:hypothetical protein
MAMTPPSKKVKANKANLRRMGISSPPPRPATPPSAAATAAGTGEATYELQQLYSRLSPPAREFLRNMASADLGAFVRLAFSGVPPPLPNAVLPKSPRRQPKLHPQPEPEQQRSQQPTPVMARGVELKPEPEVEPEPEPEPERQPRPSSAAQRRGSQASVASSSMTSASSRLTEAHAQHAAQHTAFVGCRATLCSWQPPPAAATEDGSLGCGGVLHYIGTRGSSRAWHNPADAGEVTVRWSSRAAAHDSSAGTTGELDLVCVPRLSWAHRSADYAASCANSSFLV